MIKPNFLIIQKVLQYIFRQQLFTESDLVLYQLNDFLREIQPQVVSYINQCTSFPEEDITQIIKETPAATSLYPKQEVKCVVLNLGLIKNLTILTLQNMKLVEQIDPQLFRYASKIIEGESQLFADGNEIIKDEIIYIQDCSFCLTKIAVQSIHDQSFQEMIQDWYKEKHYLSDEENLIKQVKYMIIYVFINIANMSNQLHVT